MSDMLELIGALLALSVPFMFGVIIGRAVPRSPTDEHVIGSEVLRLAHRVDDTLKFVGPNYVVSQTATLTGGGRKPVLVRITNEGVA